MQKGAQQMNGDPGRAWSDHVDFADIPLAHSTGLVFVAGALRLTDIGMPDLGTSVLNAGGCAENRALAQLKCTGELAEKLAILNCGPAVRESEGLSNEEDIAALRDHVHLLSGLDMPTDGAGVPGINLKTRRAVRLPRALVYRQVQAPEIHQAGSNGCAAGATFDDAAARAILELVERDAVTLWWYGRRRAVQAKFAPAAAGELSGFLSRVRPGGARPAIFLNLTTDIPIPVIAAISHDGSRGHCAIGFGAGLSPSGAAMKAVCEMSQMELAYDLAAVKSRMGKALTETDRAHLARLTRYTTAGPSPLADLNNVSPDILPDGQAGPDPLGPVLSCLCGSGYDAYAVDMSLAATDHTIVRAIVPGLQPPEPDVRTDRLIHVLNATGCALQDAITPGPY